MAGLTDAVAALHHADDVLADPEFAEPVLLLDEVRRFIARYLAFPSRHALTAVTLWAAHTHVVDRFDSTPRLALLSAEKRSGKSRTLEVLELLVAGPELLAGASPPFMFRRIAEGEVTVLLDECDAIWKRRNGDESAEALRSIVNAGHRKGATVGRVETAGKIPKLARFPVFAPVALAGIGDLPDTIMDRSVIVRMRRRAPDEPVDEFRARTTRPEGEALRDRLAAWCESVGDRVGEPWPVMPDGVTDRAADVWEPLLCIATLAGGHWPQSARDACVAMVTGSVDDTMSSGVRLLADVREVWDDSPAIATAEILRRLHALDESPWRDVFGKPLDDRGLAKRLKPYGISSTKVRIGESSVRGYRRGDLHDAWKRYLAPVSGTSGTSGTVLARHVPDVPDVPLRTATPCAICSEPLGAAYERLGRTTHPGCRAVAGGTR